ncbi:MAG: penicillin-binding protein 1A, partial [Ignavibacteria bacterium]
MGKKNFSRDEIYRYLKNGEFRKETHLKFYRKHKKGILISLLISIVLFIVFIVYIFSGLPSFEELENPRPYYASNVYASDGRLIGQFFIQNRIEVGIDSIPKHLINALIATEDRKFYKHWGLDIDRIAKAIFFNVITLSRRSGGASTITQQLARNLYKLVEKEQNPLDLALRKIREMITAVQLERNFTKNEILEMYLNISYFGRGNYGIEAAARNYFGKTVKDLTLRESTILISLLRNPTYYDPIRNPQNSYGRSKLILKIMLEQGYINENQFNRALKEVVEFKKAPEFTSTIAPHFLEYVRQQLIQRSEKYEVDIYRDGLNIFTTIDYEMQKHANEAVKEHLKEFQPLFEKAWNWSKNQNILNYYLNKAIKSNPEYISAETEEEKKFVETRLRNNPHFIDSVKHNALKIEVGFVVIDPKTGHIKAMVGGSNPNFMYGLNHVTQIKRQPGSAFKPIIYTVAIDNGFPIAGQILNEPITIRTGGKIYSPKNSDGKYGGYLSLRNALAQSVNVVSVRLIYEGLAPLNEIPVYAQRLGIKSKINPYYSIALGTSEVSPIELTAAFSTFANLGIYNEPIGILKIEDKNGLLIEEFKSEMKFAISPQTAFLVTELMRGVVDYGTAAGIRRFFNLPAAGKTGTTQDFTDAWFVGFTPNLCAGV